VAPIERLFGPDAAAVSDPDFRLLLAANAMGALTTALVSPVLDSLTGPLGVDAATVGLIVTAATAPSVLLIPLSGLLTDRVGRKPVLVAGLTCFGVGGLAVALTTEFRVVLALRALQGVGFSGITPVIITSVGDLYEGDAEATAQGIRFGTSGLSQAVFPAIGGAAVVVAWQAPFVIYGLALPVAALVALRFDEPAIPGRTDGGPAPGREYLAGLTRLAVAPRAAGYVLARMVVVLPFIAFLTYNSLVVVRFQGGGPGTAGVLVALFSTVFAVTATQAGRVVAALDRTPPLVAGNLLLGGGLAGFALAPGPLMAAPAAAAMGVGVGLTFSLYRSVVTGLAPQQYRGGLVSVAESGGRLAATVTPLLVGLALAAVEPRLGAEALRWVVVGVGVLSAATGTALVVAAGRAPPVDGRR
jgi:MFS family permease